MANNLIKRGGYFYFVRRVPGDVAKYDSRQQVRISLKTKDPAKAHAQAAEQNDALEKYWGDLIKHKRVHGTDEKWHDAVTLARANRFVYRTANELVEAGDVEEMVRRADMLENKGVEPRLTSALLGGAGKPVIRYSSALNAYFDLTQDRLIGKSVNGVRKWKNPRKRAVSNFEKSQGDIAIADTTPRHLLDFKKWWLDRIIEEEKSPATANKDFIHLKDILKVVSKHYEIKLNISTIFDEIMFDAPDAHRLPFETSFIQDNILKPGALDGLNEEARAVVYMMADTGCGPSELVGMIAGDDLVLDAEIPFIWIRPNKNRTLKTEARPRQIPLVGAALYGARLIPDGFKRYKTGEAVSALINPYFRERGWQLTKDHTLYSLRHSFKDRLRSVDAPEELKDELMGHANDKPKYGRGYTLEKKLEWLKKIAFNV